MEKSILSFADIAVIGRLRTDPLSTVSGKYKISVLLKETNAQETNDPEKSTPLKETEPTVAILLALTKGNPVICKYPLPPPVMLDAKVIAQVKVICLPIFV